MSANKTPGDTAVITREIVMPQHTTPQKTLFGGQLMAWIDVVAAMPAPLSSLHEPLPERVSSWLRV